MTLCNLLIVPHYICPVHTQSGCPAVHPVMVVALGITMSAIPLVSKDEWKMDALRRRDKKGLKEPTVSVTRM